MKATERPCRATDRKGEATERPCRTTDKNEGDVRKGEVRIKYLSKNTLKKN